MTTLARPIILVVGAGDEFADALRGRFGVDYEIVVAADDASATQVLRSAAQDGSQVALVVAALWAGGLDHLARVRDHHPGAMRVLVILVGDVAAQQDIRRALTLNQIDFFLGVPWASPEEELYPVIGEALRLWARDHQPKYDKAVIIDRDEDGRGRWMKTMLDRNAVWCTLHTVDSPQGRELIEKHELSTDRLPIVVLWDGRVLIDPDYDEITSAMGARSRPPEGIFDVAVVGGGPAGLAAAAYAASEGLRVVGIESTAMGGQAGTTSRIRNYLGFRWGISGSEFAERAGHHAEDLGADYVFGRSAQAIRTDGDLRVLTLDNGDEIRARAVVLAGGVVYRRLGVPEVDDLTGAGVFYGAAASEAQTMAGLDVYVLGGGNSAGQIATHLAEVGARATIVIRRDSLAYQMADYLVQQVEATRGLTVRTNTQIVGAGSTRQLEQLVLRDTVTGAEETVKADALFVFIGAEPNTEWLRGAIALDDHGFVQTGRDIPAEDCTSDDPPAFLETSMPGVFAAGDIRHRSVKRVAAAVGEGSTAILLIREYLSDAPKD